MPKNAKVILLARGGSSIEIDGQEYAQGTRNVTIRGGFGQVPTVELELMTLTSTTVDVPGAEIDISTPERELLISLGWTPPQGDAAVADGDTNS